MSNKGTIILDRDGVLNQVRSDYVKSVNELVVVNGSMNAVKKLCQNNYKVVVASNQSAFSKKLINEKILKDIENVFFSLIKQRFEFYYCLHSADEGCECRKPKTGLIDDIKSRYPPPYTFVGDNITDFYAAKNSGIKFVLVRTGHGSKFSEKLKDKCHIFDNLLEFVDTICSARTLLEP